MMMTAPQHGNEPTSDDPNRSDPVVGRAFGTVWLLLGVMALGVVLILAFAWVLTHFLA